MYNKKILVAGARGMVGSAIVRTLLSRGYNYILRPDHHELDCIDQAAVRSYMQRQRPDIVVIAAAKVGGIYANATYPAEFLYDNVMIAGNLIHCAHEAGVERLLFLGSTCIYPKYASQPISEDSLLTASLEPTNEAYAVAKIVGVKMCQYYSKQYGRSYFSAMPTNLYGPGDNYHSENSHVLPALLRRFHEAKVSGAKDVVVWGTGDAKREFLYVDDLAEACVFLLEKYNDNMHINVGSYEEITVGNLARKIAGVVGFTGKIINDRTKPDGTPRKKSDISRITALGWKPYVSIDDGLRLTYQDFLENSNNLRF